MIIQLRLSTHKVKTYISLKLLLLVFFFSYSHSVVYSQCTLDVDAGPDEYFCENPATTQLFGSVTGNNILDFYWSPPDGLSNVDILNPNATISNDMQYILTGVCADYSNNLVVNGDFSGGNTSFDTDYTYSANPSFPLNQLNEGFYSISDDPAPAHVNWQSCGDHTTGTGDMMLVNGHETAGQDAWCQDINVMPNSDYVFSAWVASVDPNGPCVIQFQINGSQIGGDNVALSTTCLWENFFTLWNSGANTTITLCIEDINTAEMGNDFAIDDIVFAPTYEITDTVDLFIHESPEPEIIGLESICFGETTTLEVTGPNSPYQSVLWNTGDATTEIVVFSTNTYLVTVTDDNGCTNTEEHILEVMPQIETSIDETICEGEDYLGFTMAGLHQIIYEANNGCDSFLFIDLMVQDQLITDSDITICEGDSYNGFTTAGVYSDTLMSQFDCDSIHILTLNIEATSRDTLETSICANTFYEGYMQTGVFIDTFLSASGCDSIRVLDLLVEDEIIEDLDQSICDGQSFEGYNTTGMYRDTLVSTNGCDSIRVLNLMVVTEILSDCYEEICVDEQFLGYSMTGVYIDTFTTLSGCDSIRTLTLEVLDQKESNIQNTICQGDIFLGYMDTGTYIDTLVATNGCDSIRTLELVVVPVITSMVSQSICKDDFFENYNIAGMYVDTLVANVGCDSIRFLTLEVIEPSTSELSADICVGQDYFGYTMTGTYIDTLAAANGCDSIRVIDLLVLDNTTSMLNQNICSGQKFLGYATSGVYIDTLVNAVGCDSIRTLVLDVDDPLRSTFNYTVCAGQSFEGYDLGGTYIDTFVNNAGCDSIRTLVLDVDAPIVTSVNISICDGDNYEGYIAEGTYIDTLSNAVGCDSIRTLVLEVQEAIIATLNAQICNGQSYEGYTTSGTYLDTLSTISGCDSIRELILAVSASTEVEQSITLCPDELYDFNGDTISDEGTYFGNLTTIDGCDSMIVLNVEIYELETFLTDDVILCDDSQFAILSDYDTTYWYDNSVSGSNLVTQSGDYVADAIDNNGCAVSDTIHVEFGTQHYLPNVFSPNRDGFNDYFRPEISDELNALLVGFDFSIYDRWGNRLYHNTHYDHNDASYGWDGDFKVEECNPGVYVYMLKIETDFCKTVRTGDVTIMK